jgi:hypothetical protein
VRKATLLFACALVAAAAEPLTELVEKQFLAGLHLVLDIGPSPEFDARMRNAIRKGWDQENVRKDVESLLKFSEGLQPMTPLEREAATWMARAAMLAKVRQAAANGDADCKLAVELYDRAHPPIAPGMMPLTRETAGAYIDLLTFIGSERVAAGREASIQSLVNEYPKANAEIQMEVQRSPGVLAAVRARWDRLSEADRANAKRSLRMRYAPTAEDRAFLSQMQAQIRMGLAHNQAQMLQKSWNNFMGNMETVYGYKRWNPVTNRYDTWNGMTTTMH